MNYETPSDYIDLIAFIAEIELKYRWLISLTEQQKKDFKEIINDFGSRALDSYSERHQYDDWGDDA